MKSVEAQPTPAEEMPSELNCRLLARFRRGSDIRNMEISVEYLVDGILPCRSVTLLYARGGMGKTTLVSQLADALSNGSLFMGLKTRCTNVFVIDYENPLPVLRDRCMKAGALDVFFLSSCDNPPKLDKADWVEYKALIEQVPDCLLIFDTLRSAQSGNENDSQEMERVMGRLRELRDAGATILLLHHTPKSSMMQYKGSSAIFDMADHILALYPVRKGTDQEVEQDEDDADRVYRFGTRDKSRYRPFTMHLAFDREAELFKAAPDPEAEKFEILHQIISRIQDTGNAQAHQSAVVEACKQDGRFPENEKRIRDLLKRGTTRYWDTRKGMRNATIYIPLSLQGSSASLGHSKECVQTAKLDSAWNPRSTADDALSRVNTDFGRFSITTGKLEKLPDEGVDG
jgi:hypothetical protein